MTSWTELIAISGKPNRNGVVCSREVMEDALDVYMKKPNRFGKLDTILNIEVPEANISHTLDRVYWEGDKLYGTITILKTPAGEKLLNIISMYSESMTLGMSYIARMKEPVGSKDLFETVQGKIVDNFEICSVNVIPKHLTNH